MYNTIGKHTFTWWNISAVQNKKTEQILREQKRMKMLTDLHKIHSE